MNHIVFVLSSFLALASVDAEPFHHIVSRCASSVNMDGGDLQQIVDNINSGSYTEIVKSKAAMKFMGCMCKENEIMNENGFNPKLVEYINMGKDQLDKITNCVNSRSALKPPQKDEDYATLFLYCLMN